MCSITSSSSPSSFSAQEQAGYQKAKQDLQELILDKNVTIETVARDKFKRPVAKVKVGTHSVNKAMKKHQK